MYIAVLNSHTQSKDEIEADEIEARLDMHLMEIMKDAFGLYFL